MRTYQKSVIQGVFHSFIVLIFVSAFLFPLTNYALEAQDQTAEIIINKLVDGQPATGWEFTISLGEGIEPLNSFTDSNGVTNFIIEIADESTAVDVVDVIETLQSGYDMVTAYCILNNEKETEDLAEGEEVVEELEPNIGIFNNIDRVENIEIAPDDIIECSFENHLHTFCGDGIKQMPNDDEVEEECDIEDGVPDAHYECTLNCNLEYIPYCGDKIKNSDEECDDEDGITNDQICSDECLINEIELAPEEEITEEKAPQPILSVAKSVDKSSAEPSDTLLYTVVINNTGRGQAENVSLTDILPDGFHFLDEDGNNTLESEKTWSWDKLEANSDISISYEVVVDSQVEENIYENTVMVSASNHEQDVITKTSTEVQIPVILEEVTTSLSIAKSVDREFANPGDTVTYTITVSNEGEALATQTILEDILPNGFFLSETDESKLKWNIGELEPGATITKTYPVKIDPAMIPGNYSNTASACAEDANCVTATASIEIRALEVLGAEEDLLPDTGNSIIFAISGLILISTGILVRKRLTL